MSIYFLYITRIHQFEYRQSIQKERERDRRYLCHGSALPSCCWLGLLNCRVFLNLSSASFLFFFFFLFRQFLWSSPPDGGSGSRHGGGYYQQATTESLLCAYRPSYVIPLVTSRKRIASLHSRRICEENKPVHHHSIYIECDAKALSNGGMLVSQQFCKIWTRRETKERERERVNSFVEFFYLFHQNVTPPLFSPCKEEWVYVINKEPDVCILYTYIHV